ncbi:CRISPR-associated endoribonuclease Cas6 [Streptococcus mitis]|jgi:CRISPR-associated endoribonuclease cas6|uniref:CRISPR-associated endoribonuclease n=1 Tax=Streptococcus mitis TaxID=28037 RepID=A0A4U1LB42_STRMT|nr:CRISPR-associated endoribonuclease Cas6 [Streptococcus mitis]QKL32968.1 CRISPR-associated endoribonuclease Cas6 [Streptococcus mitis]TKD53606.1 CRISPR-associated endoribonuclease Cas6 [Streptococcus mitis]
MQLLIELKKIDQFSLPVNYNYLLQSMIYNLLDNKEKLSRKIHETGYQIEDKHFKLFTFSLLRGQYKIHGKRIEFLDKVRFEIRTVDKNILLTIVESLLNLETLRIGQNLVKILNVKIGEKKLTGTSYKIRMISPLVVRSTDADTKKTLYYNPFDTEFKSRIMENFERKYQAYYHKVPTGRFDIEPINYSLKNKFVTKYKDFLITGWRGEFEIRGDAEVLDFLYQVGLGEKNSMGFGMFVIEE